MFGQPVYDLLVIGSGFRRAYRNGVLVDEHTGEPLAEMVGGGTIGIVCEACGVTFAPRRPAKTCSARCRKRLSRQRRQGVPVPAK